VAVILAALPVLATTLFSDDFNRADNDLLGGNWVERGPSVDFDIVTGRVQVMAYATSLIGVAYNPAGISSADYTVQAIVNPATGDTLTGVCGRRVNFSTADSDGYMAFIHDTANSLFLYKRVSGTWTELGSFAVTITAGTDYTVKLSMQGTTIKAFLDGVERISVTDSSLSAAGDAGLCINGGAENTGMRWDDFLVEDFGAPATPRKRAAVVFAKAHLHQPNREGIK
jgi:hypothetical protein